MLVCFVFGVSGVSALWMGGVGSGMYGVSVLCVRVCLVSLLVFVSVVVMRVFRVASVCLCECVCVCMCVCVSHPLFRKGLRARHLMFRP